jgi:hypothetical protein
MAERFDHLCCSGVDALVVFEPGDDTPQASSEILELRKTHSSERSGGPWDVILLRSRESSIASEDPRQPEPDSVSRSQM